MKNSVSLIEEMVIVAKKHGYTVSDCMIDNHRVEVGMLKDEGTERIEDSLISKNLKVTKRADM